jgi:hypothetical protein
MPKPPGAVVTTVHPSQRAAGTPLGAFLASFPPAPDFRIG